VFCVSFHYALINYNLTKEKSLIPALKPILDALRSVRFYIGDEYDEIENVGEL